MKFFWNYFLTGRKFTHCEIHVEKSVALTRNSFSWEFLLKSLEFARENDSKFYGHTFWQDFSRHFVSHTNWYRDLLLYQLKKNMWCKLLFCVLIKTFTSCFRFKVESVEDTHCIYYFCDHTNELLYLAVFCFEYSNNPTKTS